MEPSIQAVRYLTTQLMNSRSSRISCSIIDMGGDDTVVCKTWSPADEKLMESMLASMPPDDKGTFIYCLFPLQRSALVDYTAPVVDYTALVDVDVPISSGYQETLPAAHQERRNLLEIFDGHSLLVSCIMDAKMDAKAHLRTVSGVETSSAWEDLCRGFLRNAFAKAGVIEPGLNQLRAARKVVSWHNVFIPSFPADISDVQVIADKGHWGKDTRRAVGFAMEPHLNHRRLRKIGMPHDPSQRDLQTGLAFGKGWRYLCAPAKSLCMYLKDATDGDLIKRNVLNLLNGSSFAHELSDSGKV